MSADAERFARLQDLFTEAMSRPPATRSGFLLGACGDDPELLADVARLLAAAVDADDMFEHPRVPLPPDLFSSEAGPLPGDRIGVYQITRLVGSGGMGAVYEAVRDDDQFRKRVAIKVIKRGMDTDLAIRRFRTERQILAGLVHRNIAGLLDGGVMADGRPYFVMEYVDGVSITRYCAERRLDLAGRLTLFRQVCAAVQYAHGRLVVHRDLKPGNILVTPDGTVQLLDFGIARLLGEGEGSGDLPATRGGLGALTPQYASPEMVRGLPVTTAVDVYSLGVVLFELLTGVRPYEFPDLASATIERVVCEQTPDRPSSVASAAVAEASQDRSLPRYRRRLAGELDTIVLTAIRKEPERRYPSVDNLADDLGRYQKGLPIRAAPDWVAYRLRKFVGRNRVVLSAAALVVLSLIGGMVVSQRQARRADRERARAEEINRFVTTVLASPDPAASGKDVLVADVLQKAAARIDSELVDQPDVAERVRSTIGFSYLGLGKYEEARVQFAAALGLSRRLYGPESPAAITALNNLASVSGDAGEWETADSLWRVARGMLERHGVRDSLYAIVLHNMGTSERRLGRLDSAETFLRASLAIKRKLFDRLDPTMIPTLNDLGVALGSQQRWAAAESLHREALAISEQIYGHDHVTTASALNGLAGALDLQDKLGPADSAYLETLAIRRRILGTDHPDYLFTLFNYGVFLIFRNRCEDAIKVAREVLSHRSKSLPEAHPAVASGLQTLGRCLDREGRFAEGGAALLESLDLRRKYLPKDHWLITISESFYGEHLGKAGRPAEAEPVLVASYSALSAKLGKDHPRTLEALNRVIGFYENAHRAAKAAEFKAKLAR